jgi:hypothetical protein
MIWYATGIHEILFREEIRLIISFAPVSVGAFFAFAMLYIHVKPPLTTDGTLFKYILLQSFVEVLEHLPVFFRDREIWIYRRRSRKLESRTMESWTLGSRTSGSRTLGSINKRIW